MKKTYVVPTIQIRPCAFDIILTSGFYLGDGDKGVFDDGNW